MAVEEAKGHCSRTTLRRKMTRKRRKRKKAALLLGVVHVGQGPVARREEQETRWSRRWRARSPTRLDHRRHLRLLLLSARSNPSRAEVRRDLPSPVLVRPRPRRRRRRRRHQQQRRSRPRQVRFRLRLRQHSLLRSNDTLQLQLRVRVRRRRTSLRCRGGQHQWRSRLRSGRLLKSKPRLGSSAGLNLVHLPLHAA